MPPPRVDTRFLMALTLAALSACQSVGLPEQPAPAPARPPPEPDPVITDRVQPDPLPSSGFAESVREPVDVGTDPILASAAAQDTTFQRQVAFWMDFWKEEQAENFARYLERMGQYGALVQDALASRELPESLRYLPIVESGYFPRAVSRVGATGLWQLMGPTARGLGVEVGSVVDDRRDPFAATDAALAYLEGLHEDFGSWFLALAAYNAGPGRVGRLLTRSGRTGVDLTDEDFLLIRRLLPAETREFVPRFFAAAALARDPVSHGFEPIRPFPFLFDEVVVPDATSLDVIARAVGVTEAEIQELNPRYVRGFTPIGAERSVRVPLGTGASFLTAYAMIPPEERLSFLEHVVGRGETFSHIALMYGVGLPELQDTNGNVDPRRLQIGMTIVVPVGARGGRGGSSQVASLGGASGLLHVVREGESLWRIARRYGVSTDALARANQRESNPLIHPGDELRIP